MKRIYIDPDLCEGCESCVLACALAHSDAESILDLDLEDINNIWRNEIVLNIAGDVVPLFCRHCDEPECVYACMSGALKRDEDTGYVLCDEDKCAGCWMCVMSCPYGMIKPDPTGTHSVKCDMCIGRENPACVENCPTGAISIVDIPVAIEVKRS